MRSAVPFFVVLSIGCVTDHRPDSVGGGTDVSSADVGGDVALDAGLPAPEVGAQDVPSAAPPAVVAVVDRQIKSVLLNLIQSATTRLDVFQFEFIQTGSVKDIRDALLDAAKRGVQVRVLLDQEVDDNEEAVEVLAAGGVDARIDGSPVRVHLKVVSADGQALVVGSTNFSGASIDFNHEANLLVRDPEVVAYLGAYLDAVWADPGHDPSALFPGSGPHGAWVDGGYVGVALPRIQAATERIDLLLYGINLDPKYPDGPVQQLAGALYAAVARGVAVRVLFEHSDWNLVLNDLNEAAAEVFEAHGVDVRFDDDETVTHAKMLLVDGAALVGTNNWGYKGLALDHEAGVVTTEPTVIGDLGAYFEVRWSEAK